MKIKSRHAAPALVIVVSAMLLASSLLMSSVDALNENPYLSFVAIQLAVMALPTVFYCRLRHNELDGRMRVRVFGLGHIMIIIFAALLVISSNALISVTVYRLFPEAYKASIEAEANTYMTAGSADYLYSAVAFAIIPAITEEFLFRSVIAAEYERMSVPTAVVMSSVMFAMIHFSFVRFPAYFVTGLVLAAVMYAARSVFASIAVHIICNLTSLFLDEYLNRIFLGEGMGITLLHIILTALTVVFAILFFGEARSLYKSYAAANVPSEYKAKKHKGVLPRIAEAMLTPTFIILTVFFIIAASVR